VHWPQTAFWEITSVKPGNRAMGMDRNPLGSEHLRLSISGAYQGGEPFMPEASSFRIFPAHYDAPGSIAGHLRGVRVRAVSVYLPTECAVWPSGLRRIRGPKPTCRSLSGQPCPSGRRYGRRRASRPLSYRRIAYQYGMTEDERIPCPSSRFLGYYVDRRFIPGRCSAVKSSIADGFGEWL
jgi:hypothetical protein